MKKKSKRRQISQETEINTILLLSLGIITLVISCALLTVMLTDGHGDLVATIETKSVSYDETSETGNEDESVGEDATEGQEQSETESQTENESDIEVDVSIEYMSSEASEETSTFPENGEVTESSAEAGAQQEVTGVTRYIFVGDSRYVGMLVLAQSDDYFVAEEGKGYYYMVEHEADIKAAIIPGAVLIIGMGVNDVKSNVTDLYIQKINEWAQTLGISVYYMLVNPVDEATEAEHGYDITNDEIDEFNAALQAGLDSSVHIIDTNSYLKGDGFVTGDGVHYNTETYQKIYSYIRAQVLLAEQSAWVQANLENFSFTKCEKWCITPLKQT